MSRPQFKPHFHIEVVEPETVYLLSEQGHFALSGRLYCQLAPLLNGRHTVNEIVNQLQGQVSIAAVYYALMLLKNKGYITEADDTLSPEVAAFWNLLNVDARVATSCLQETQVSVTAFGAVPTAPFISGLESLNIQVCNPKSNSPCPPLPKGETKEERHNEKSELAVVLTDDYLQLGLDTFNREALQAGRPWMLVKPVGGVIWIGPIFHPGKTGCWQCLAQRLRGNRQVETTIQQQKEISTPFSTSRSILPSTLQAGLNLAATEIAKWIVCADYDQLEGKLVTLDLVSLNLQRHTLVRRPQCPACGNPASFSNQEPQPLVLVSRKKQFTTDGGHRSFSPEVTLRQYEHHISPITGVVSALFRSSEAENDLVHVYFAAHSFGSDADNLKSLRYALGHKSAGKGKSDQQSRASGLCEAIERYCGIYTGDEIRVNRTYAQLGKSAIHPNACMQFSAAQYENSREWNQQHPGFNWVPEPFNEEEEIEWTPVWSLTHQTFKYLPTAFCYYGYPLPKGSRFCFADSNGNAAGNTLEEAILQGFMELVERDSVALWWYNRLKRPAVDLGSFDEPYLQALQDYYKTQQRDLWVLDITSDLNIPVFAAVSRRTDRPIEDIMLGFGAHFDPKIAILRAVTELNQSLPFDHIAELDSNAVPLEQDLKDWLTTATLDNQPYLAPDTRVVPKVYADYSQRWSEDLRDDVLTCVEIAAQRGLETLVLDQTRPDIGLSVVKVIVPGLRHFWARLAPGRLYDVPVQLGWLPAPLSEQQLNPVPMFL